MTILNGDCFELLKSIEDGSVDMVLTDPPYNTTNCRWDRSIDLDLLWKELNRVCKKSAAMVMTASQPFTTDLIQSNRKDFRYELIWEKDKGSNPLLANKMPLKSHENIVVFYRKLPTYNPQWTYGDPYTKIQGKCTFGEVIGGGPKPSDKINTDGRRFPKSVIKISRDMNRDKSKSHPTQKPLKLFEWLILTYSNIGDLVLDPFAGSCTTGVACSNLDRRFICIEKEIDYCNIGFRRIYG